MCPARHGGTRSAVALRVRAFLWEVLLWSIAVGSMIVRAFAAAASRQTAAPVRPLMSTAFDKSMSTAFDATRLELPGSALFVTTARGPSESMLLDARVVSQRLEAPLMLRGNGSLRRLFDESGVEFAYVVAREPGGTAVRHQICRRSDERKLFAHPRQWRRAQAAGLREAPLARALCPPGAAEPSHVIDATAGLGGTALRIAHTFGCRVTAVEVSAPLACVLDYGMRSLAAQDKPWAPAAQRITVVHADADTFLADRPTRACAVYLNPCMDVRHKDREDEFLQQVARLTPISSGCIQSALSAAKGRVVLRMPVGSEPPQLLGVEPTECVRGGQSNYWRFEL